MRYHLHPTSRLPLADGGADASFAVDIVVAEEGSPRVLGHVTARISLREAVRALGLGGPRHLLPRSDGPDERPDPGAENAAWVLWALAGAAEDAALRRLERGETEDHAFELPAPLLARRLAGRPDTIAPLLKPRVVEVPAGAAVV